MGVCINVPGANYSAKNLGVAHPTDVLPIEAIAVIGEDSIIGVAAYYARLYPIFTSQRNIAWAIVSGNSYATISSSGVVTPASGVISQSVTIRCTSTDNSSIYGEKTISVTDDAALPTIKTTITFDGHCAIDTGIDASMPTEIQVTMAEMYPAEWGVLSGNAYTSIIIGGRESSSSKRRDIQLQAIGQTAMINQIVFGVGSTSKNIQNLSLSPSAELYLAQGPTFYQYNEITEVRTSQDTFDSSVHFVIGAQNNNGTIDYTYGSHDKFKRVKIYATEGGTLLGDFVPAIKNGVPGMWDYVTQTFFTNIGTGTFIVQ